MLSLLVDTDSADESPDEEGPAMDDSPDEDEPAVDDSPGRQLDAEGGKMVKKRGNAEVPKLGLICHNCRQRQISILDHVTCSRCPLRFCGRCLLNRHGELIESEISDRWVCPRCRGGCGPGCYKTCCNCGPCRKGQNLQPTGQLVRTARDAGFSNVHDYLVHLETGESPDAIANRKHGRGWTSTDTSATATMEFVAVVLGRRHNALALAKKGQTKKRRSKRFLLVNSNWGSVTIPGYNEQEVFEGRLLVADSRSTWEVGRKPKRKLPDFSTDDQIFTEEPILDPNWEIGRNFQSESDTEDLMQTLDSTRKIGAKPRSKNCPKLKVNGPRSQTKNQMLIQEHCVDSTLEMRPDTRREDQILSHEESLFSQVGRLDDEHQWSFSTNIDTQILDYLDYNLKRGFNIQSL